MPKRYLALLRAVNVGKTWIAMEELRRLSEKEGFANVSTYIQSGNIVFTSDKSHAECTAAIAASLETQLRAAVTVLVKTEKQLRQIVDRNPFVKEVKIDPAALHVTFLEANPSAKSIERLSAIKSGLDRFQISGDVVYLHCPGGYGRTKLSNAVIERKLDTPATTRNWKTVNVLLTLLKGS
jgi:uncharacterized protein (DUF1697 family)